MGSGIFGRCPEQINSSAGVSEAVSGAGKGGAFTRSRRKLSSLLHDGRGDGVRCVYPLQPAPCHRTPPVCCPQPRDLTPFRCCLPARSPKEPLFARNSTSFGLYCSHSCAEDSSCSKSAARKIRDRSFEQRAIHHRCFPCDMARSSFNHVREVARRNERKSTNRARTKNSRPYRVFVLSLDRVRVSFHVKNCYDFGLELSGRSHL